MTRLPFLTLACLTALVLGGLSDARAQSRPISVPENETPLPPPRRPYQGLFNGSADRSNQSGFSLSLQSYAAHGDQLQDTQQGRQSSSLGTESLYSALDASMRFQKLPRPTAARSTPRGVMVLAEVNSHAPLYSAEQSLRQGSHAGQLALSLSFGRSATLSSQQMVAYSPFYQPSLIPTASAQSAEVAPLTLPRSERDTTTLKTINYASSVQLSHSIGRTGFSYNYSRGGTHFDADVEESRTQQAGARLERPAGRYGLFRVGYQFRESRQGFGTQGDVVVHDALIGGTYARPLSFSRRTTIGFDGGSTIIEDRFSRRFDLVANANIGHEFGRSWRLGGAYSQGAHFSEVLAEPLFARSVAATLTGLLNRRTDLFVNVAYALGQLQGAITDNPYTSYEATARLRIAATRSLAVFADYSFYAYEFDTSAGLSAFSPSTNRQSTRVGVDWWLGLGGQR